MQSEKLCIKNRDNYELSAIYYQNNPGSVSDVLIIVCHGFSGDKNEWGRFPRTCERLCDVGYDAIIFDFSGSGENVRIPITLTKQVQDLEDVAAWAGTRGYKTIGTIGLSFGGITSLLANITNRKVAIFWAPAFYMTRIIGNGKRRLANVILTFVQAIKMGAAGGSIHVNKKFFQSIWNVDVETKLREFDLPSLIVQGTLDKAVLLSDSERAISLMKNDGTHQLHVVEGADHDFANDHLEEFIDVSIDYLKKYLNP